MGHSIHDEFINEHLFVMPLAEPQEARLEEEDDNVDLANALDLSESEEEEELEDIINDFALQEEDLETVRFPPHYFFLSLYFVLNIIQDLNVRQEKLYFFQFPDLFPTFLPRESAKAQDVEMVDAAVKQEDKGKAPEGLEKVKKAVKKYASK